MKNEKYQSALKKASALCSRSEKCKSDIRAKLIVWGINNESDINKMLQWLTDNQFIDEKRYSHNYTQDKHRFNKWGKIKIRAGLRLKGIGDENIELAFAAIDPDEYRLLLKAELSNKKKNIKSANQYELKGKLFRFASSRGYEADLIYKLLDESDN